MLTPLFQAIENQDLNLIAELLSNGTNPNIISPEFPGWTPLYHPIEQLEDGGSIEPLVLLLRHGASVNIWDADCDATPLLYPFRIAYYIKRLASLKGSHK